MPNNLRIRIEVSPPGKSILPWSAIMRRGRNTADSQLFAVAGYPENELLALNPAVTEEARERLEMAIRMLTAFEYIPNQEAELETFFEKKLLAFEERVNLGGAYPTIHCALGITHKNRILFATSGDILALNITNAMVSNLNAHGETGAFHFSNFQSGVLPARSCLLIIPKEIGVALKTDEMKRALLDPSTNKIGILERIWRTRGNPKIPLRAILLESKLRALPSSEATSISIANLLNTEARTEKLLSPPLIQLKPIAGFLKIASVRLISGLVYLYLKAAAAFKKAAAGGVQKRSPVTLPSAKRAAASRPEVTAKPAPDPETRPSKEFTPLKYCRAHYGKLRARLISALRLWLNRAVKPLSTERWIDRFNALPRKSKTIFLGITIFFFVFAQSILLTSRSNRASSANAAMREEIQSIRTALDQASASLIYNDENAARQLLQEAQDRLNALPEKQREIFNASGAKSFGFFASRPENLPVEEVSQSAAKLEEQLRRAVSIENPVILDPAQTESLALKAFSGRSFQFGSRHYELRADENQIFRHEKSADGFSAQGAPWIKDGTNVKGAVSIAIDGAIYAGMDNGQVIKLLKGRKENYKLSPITPELTAISKIWTLEDTAYLYILDPAEKRLLVFNKKDGLLKVQYLSPTFGDLQDFKIDESAKTAYLLSGQQVLSVPLSHF